MTGPVDDQLWAAVSEPGRRRLLDILVDDGEATPTALAAQLPITRQAVSKHLAVLLDAGLVTQRRDGREVRYAVDPGQLEAAVREMSTAVRRWNTRLLAIRRMAEDLNDELSTRTSSEPGTSSSPATGHRDRGDP
jgi:ArsR family transcriptional regulator, cadmium/lead-responsive transcriptional repressor